MMNFSSVKSGEMRFYPIMVMLITLLAFLSSCDVHQFPEPQITPDNPEKPDIPDLPEEKVEVPLHLVYMPHFYVWEHEYDPMRGKIKELYPDETTFPNHPGTSSLYDNTLTEGVMDVHIKAFLDNSSGKLVAEKTVTLDLENGSYDGYVSIDLPIDTEYKIGVWTHLRESKEAPHFYNASDFNRVKIISDNYKGNTDYRDAFSGDIKADTYSEATEPYEVAMTRPMGKFELVTIDLSEFLDRETSRRSLPTRARAEDYNLIISFSYYFPNSYSLFDDRLENSASGVSFETKMTVNGVNEASLGFEYVMLNDISDAGVQARVDIYDPNYTHVAGSTTLTIPMHRDRHTLLRGAFLSELNDGGIGIDPDFEGDFNVTM